MADLDLTKEAIEKIVELTVSGGDIRGVEGGTIPVMIVPAGYKLERVGDLIYNDHQKTPERIKQAITVTDSYSFIHYFQLFCDTNSRVFADEQAWKIKGVLDYHAAGASMLIGEGSPRWGQHTLTMVFRSSEQWKRWTGNNNKQLSQQDFAEFLEQNAVDISEPLPASMMEVARDLNAKTDVEFGSGLRMGDGQVRFKYTETVKATVGAGQIAVPEKFKISLPIFIGGEDVTLEALLRFRVKEGHLTIWYTLVRPEEAMLLAFDVAREQIATELSITVINGSL